MGQVTRGANEVAGEGVEGTGAVDRGGAGAIIRGSGQHLINYLTLMRSFFNLINILTPVEAFQNVQFGGGG